MKPKGAQGLSGGRGGDGVPGSEIRRSFARAKEQQQTIERERERERERDFTASKMCERSLECFVVKVQDPQGRLTKVRCVAFLQQ